MRAAVFLAVGALLSACDEPARMSPSNATSAVTEGRSTCRERPVQDTSGARADIPADMRAIVSASRTVITIQSLSRDPICVPLGWIDTIEEFYLSEDKRLLDFDHSGFEDDGHFLIDRRSRQTLETGNQPEASDDGTMLLAVPSERQDSGGGERIGLWQVLPDRVVSRATLPLPDAHAWRVDRWVGNDCAEVSGVSSVDYWGPDVDGSDSDAADAAIAKLPRLHFRVWSLANRWRIDPSRDDRPCDRSRDMKPKPLAS